MASEADPFAVSAILTSTVSAEQMAEYKAAFEAVDADHSGRIAAGEIQASARGLGHDVSDEEAKELIARCAPPDLRSSCVCRSHLTVFSVDVDSDGKLGFEEFCKLMERARKAGSGGEHLRFVKGKGVGTHSWSSEEKVGSGAAVGGVCRGLSKMGLAIGRRKLSHNTSTTCWLTTSTLPRQVCCPSTLRQCSCSTLSAMASLCGACRLVAILCRGALLFHVSHCRVDWVNRRDSKLVNKIAPDTVDERALAFPKKNKALNVWERHGNANLALGAARAAGCKIINFHVEDMADCVARHSVCCKQHASPLRR